ncbi:MAG TPA: regulatory iron-sulfur-containing complex subunit RicT, partial [Candidatus Binataceae bacterium]|nr:regulatory iron-sulfur-containing complex subunit RicT [Candidatus Binataceae bacterium]
MIEEGKGAQSRDIDERGPGRLDIVGVSLRRCGRTYPYTTTLDLQRGTRVLVEGEFGLCLATVESPTHAPEPAADLSKLHPVIRVADERDLETAEQNHELEQSAIRLCQQKIRDHDLAMKLVEVEYTFDRRRAVFNFVSENRIDFRDLVRDLAANLHVRIEMRQIGARDESKVCGGCGPCGRELCCSSWLREFNPITLKMAREQNLALNPSRLAGMCGRLKCCLHFEYATYIELKRGLPSVGKT